MLTFDSLWTRMKFIIQPIDFVGETPLGSGKFTYVLEVIDFENRILNIKTSKDEI